MHEILCGDYTQNPPPPPLSMNYINANGPTCSCEEDSLVRTFVYKFNLIRDFDRYIKKRTGSNLLPNEYLMSIFDRVENQRNVATT